MADMWEEADAHVGREFHANIVGTRWLPYIYIVWQNDSTRGNSFKGHCLSLVFCHNSIKSFYYLNYHIS